jgi:hypothetical protein
VFDRGRDDVLSARRLGERTCNRGVHRFRARRREHDFARPGAEERGDLFTRALERDSRRAALDV